MTFTESSKGAWVTRARDCSLVGDLEYVHAIADTAVGDTQDLELITGPLMDDAGDRVLALVFTSQAAARRIVERTGRPHAWAVMRLDSATRHHWARRGVALRSGT